MTLHIFNPEHDIALASGLANFTAPHAGRQLRHDLGWLPAFWADPDDIILVDNLEKARSSTSHRKVLCRRFISKPSALSDLRGMLENVSSVEPWGWNAALRATLLRMGVSKHLLPTGEQIADIRQLSHRRTAAQLLEAVRKDGMTGESFECNSANDVLDLLKRYRQLVLKAPWSSSGRGVRFVGSRAAFRSPSLSGWLQNTLSAQGSVMAEPYYNKVKDFGMEFTSDGQGRVSYEGLSLFHTANGAYTGNIIATERAKREMIEGYLPEGCLDDVRQTTCDILGEQFKGRYRGPFGIDMMIVAGTGGRSTCTLHPCVEINLRRTMGHVALALQPLLNPGNDDELTKAMRIEYTNNNYKLRIKQL